MTAITEQTRSVSKSARGLNSIMASLAQVLDEDSTNGQKIAGVFDTIGESMFDANGQLKSGFDLLSALSDHWDELEHNEQVDIANLIAGKNQINNFMALMNNFDHAIEATAKALDSQGSAIEENNRYMGGLEAKVSALKQGFQDLSRNVIKSDTVKNILDLGITFLDKLNTPAGQKGTMIALLGGVVTGLAGMAKAGGLLDILGALRGKVGGIADLFGKGGKFATPTMLGALMKMPLPLKIMAGLTAGLLVLQDKLTLSYEESLDKVNGLKQEYEEMFGAASEYAELQQKEAEGGLTPAQQSELEFLERKKKVMQDLETLAEKESFEAWRREQSQPQGLGKYFDSDYASSRVPSNWANIELMGSALPWEKGLFKPFEEGKKSIEGFDEALLKVIGDATDYNKHLQEMKDKGFELTAQEEQSLSMFNKLVDIAANPQNLTDIQQFGKAYYEALLNVGKSAEEAEQIADDAMAKIWNQREEVLAKEAEDAGKTKVEAEVDYKPKFPEEDPPPKEGVVNYKANYNDMKGPPTTSYGGQSGASAEGTNNSPGGPTLVNELGPELISANGRAWIAGGGHPVVTNLPKGAIVLTADETKRALNGGAINKFIPAHKDGRGGMVDVGGNKHWGTTINGQSGYYKDPIPNSPYNPGLPARPPKPVGGPPTIAGMQGNKNPHGLTDQQLQAMGAWSGGILIGVDKGGISGNEGGTHSIITTTQKGRDKDSSGKSAEQAAKDLEKAIKEQTKAYKEQIDIMEHKLFLMEKEQASEQERIDYMREIQAELDKQKQWYYDHGEDANSEYIRNLEKQWWEYEEDIKKLYEEQAKIYENLFGAVADKAQDEIDALEKQKEEIQKQNQELQKKIELEKALDDLARARTQKKLVLRDGKMVYAQDVDAVAKAQERVDEIKNREAQDKRIEELDKQIEDWQEYKDQWSSIIDDYEKKQDLLLLKQKLGIDLEDKNWKDHLDSIESYLDKYNDLMIKAGHLDIHGKIEFKPDEGSKPTIDEILDEAEKPTLKPEDKWPNNRYPGGKPWHDGAFGHFPSAIPNIGSVANKTDINIQNFNPTLPSVRNGADFVEYLRKNLGSQILQKPVLAR